MVKLTESQIQKILEKYLGIKKLEVATEEIMKFCHSNSYFKIKDKEYCAYFDESGQPQIVDSIGLEHLIWKILLSYVSIDEADECFYAIFSKRYFSNFQTIVIEGTECSKYRKLLYFSSASGFEKSFQSDLEKILNVKLGTFMIPIMDPSANYSNGKFVFSALDNAKPATGYMLDTLIKKGASEIGCRLGTKSEYMLFLATLILKLSEVVSPEFAWDAVCNNSAKIGHYIGSENAKNEMESTGSRCVCGRCGLGNVRKVVLDDQESTSYWIVGGGYKDNPYLRPLASFTKYNNSLNSIEDAVGWYVVI